MRQPRATTYGASVHGAGNLFFSMSPKPTGRIQCVSTAKPNAWTRNDANERAASGRGEPMAKYLYHRKDNNHDAIRRALEQVGADVTVTNPGDLLVGFRGKTFILEVKDHTGKLRPSQRYFRDRWRGHYAVVRNEHEAIREISERRDRA